MISRIALNNFLSYGDTSIEIPGGLGLILGNNGRGGSNGAGKSGFIEALTWALWGVARSTDVLPAGDHLVRRGQSEMQVEIDIENNGNKLSILRSRSLSGKGATQLLPDFPGYLFGKNILDRQKQIIEILGMDFNVFKHTYFIKPNESSNFSLLTPAEAKIMVMKILNLMRWEGYHSIAKDKLQLLENQSKNINIIIETLKSQLAAKPTIISINDEINELRKQISNNEEVIQSSHKEKLSIEELININNELLGKLKNQISKDQERIDSITTSLDNARFQKQKHTARLEKTTDSISAKESLLERLNNELTLLSNEFNEKKESKTLTNDPNTINTKITKIKDELDTIHKNLSTKNGEISAARTELTSLRNANNNMCPILKESCDRIRQKDLSSEIEDLENKIEILEEEYNKLDQDKKRLSEEQIELNIIIDKIKAIEYSIDMLDGKIFGKSNEINQCRETISELVNSIDDIKTDIQDVDNLIIKFEKELEQFDQTSIEKQNNEVTTTANKINELTGNLRTIESKITTINREIDNANSTISQNEELLAEIKTLGENIANNITELDDINHKCEVMKQLVDVFSKDGIPLHIIDMSAATIENIANNILAEIGIDIAIRIRVESISKKQTVKDTFEIVVIENNNEVLYKMYSGGESFWIDFALRMALAIVERNISGSMVNTFIIDEGIGKLDGPNRERFIPVLRHIINNHNVSQILLVTHTDISESQQSVFDFIITAKKNQKITSLECRNI